MDLHARVLFCHDPGDRLVCVNEPPYPAAPRWYAGTSRDGRVVRYRTDVPGDLRAAIAALDVAAAGAAHLAAVASLLATDRPLGAIWIGPAYAFGETPTEGAGARIIDGDSRSVLLPHYPWVHAELAERAPVVAAVVDGAAVSVCCTARRTDRAAEASLDTIADYRGRGLATAVTAVWAAAVRRSGLVAMYSTSWDNLASQGVARRLGLVPYGWDAHIG